MFGMTRTAPRPAGLAELYAAEYPRLVAELILITGSRPLAEDCVSEAFTRLALRWGRLSRFERPGAWVRRVAHNLAVDERRRTGRLVPIGQSTDAARLSSVEGTTVDVLVAMKALSSGQRSVLVLHVRGLGDEEIADALKIPVGTVKSRLSRARQQIRTELHVQEESTR